MLGSGFGKHLTDVLPVKTNIKMTRSSHALLNLTLSHLVGFFPLLVNERKVDIQPVRNRCDSLKNCVRSKITNASLIF
jgi:hypothetical protein